ncbi:hypothetical protein HZC09_02610 [Candidatus Micrarchaeota archaeon]|nr:hypothetical protein [Candidatus Micrarchaeota archaeon]
MDLVRSPFEARGVIVKDAEGYRCPSCGLEVFSSEQIDAIQEIIYSFVPPVILKRKISSAAGKKPVIYLPQEILRAIGAQIGDSMELSVERRGRVVMALARSDAKVVVKSGFSAKRLPRMAVLPA